MDEIMDNVYTIGSKQYKLPREISYRQYHKITALFQEAGIDSNDLKGAVDNIDSTISIAKESGKIEADFRMGAILKALFDKDLIPKFFATIVIPVGSTSWKSQYEAENIDDMMEIGDATGLKVLQDFLSGRVSLIEGILKFFTNFMEKNPQLMRNVNQTTISEN